MDGSHCLFFGRDLFGLKVKAMQVPPHNWQVNSFFTKHWLLGVGFPHFLGLIQSGADLVQP